MAEKFEKKKVNKKDHKKEKVAADATKAGATLVGVGALAYSQKDKIIKVAKTVGKGAAEFIKHI